MLLLMMLLMLQMLASVDADAADAADALVYGSHLLFNIHWASSGSERNDK